VTSKGASSLIKAGKGSANMQEKAEALSKRHIRVSMFYDVNSYHMQQSAFKAVMTFKGNPLEHERAHFTATKVKMLEDATFMTS